VGLGSTFRSRAHRIAGSRIAIALLENLGTAFDRGLTRIILLITSGVIEAEVDLRMIWIERSTCVSCREPNEFFETQCEIVAQ
jgi:hypothetical protein